MLAIASATTWLAVIGTVLLGFTYLQNEVGYPVHWTEQWLLLALLIATPVTWWFAL